MGVDPYAAICEILETLEEVPRTGFLPQLSLAVGHMRQHENVLVVDNRDGYSNDPLHSHAMEDDDPPHSYMMHLAYLLRWRWSHRYSLLFHLHKQACCKLPWAGRSRLQVSKRVVLFLILHCAKCSSAQLHIERNSVQKWLSTNFESQVIRTQITTVRPDTNPCP